MKFRGIKILAYIIGLLLLVGCTKNVTVTTQVLPSDSGYVSGTGEYEINTKVSLNARP